MRTVVVYRIKIRTGDYDKAAQSNADAIVADREYIQKSGASGVYPMMYYNHNIHFLAAANAMKGRYADALKSAAELEANVTPHLKAMPMLEMFAPYKIVTLVRFGKWDEIAKPEKPDEALKLGTDKGANPVEYALAALAGCLTTTLVCHAAAQGVAIDINRIETRRRHRFARLSRFGLNRQKRFKPNSRQFQYQSGRAQGKATGTR